MGGRTRVSRRAAGALVLSLLAVGGLLAVSAEGIWFTLGVIVLAAALTAEAAYWLMVVVRDPSRRRT